MNDVAAILAHLQEMGNEHNREGMARFGIQTEKAFGISVKTLREIAKRVGKNHSLALDLWATSYHEARLLAVFLADKRELDLATITKWLNDFNSWDLCDQVCANLFAFHPQIDALVQDWATHEAEFERRAAFASIACLAHKKHKHSNAYYEPFFELIQTYAFDGRNYVKKGVNWALRGIGKRNDVLLQEALNCCEVLLQQPYPSAKWIAKDALRELNEKSLK